MQHICADRQCLGQKTAAFALQNPCLMQAVGEVSHPLNLKVFSSNPSPKLFDCELNGTCSMQAVGEVADSSTLTMSLGLNIADFVLNMQVVGIMACPFILTTSRPENSQLLSCTMDFELNS